MLVVNTHEATTRFSELLCPVEERGERVSLCRDRTPIAEIGPITVPDNDSLLPGPRLSGVVFHEDPVRRSPPKIGR